MPTDKQAGTETDTELLRQGLSFLHQARNIGGLDSSQVARIERRLRERKVRARRTVLWPSLAALAFVLAAGATLAVAERGLRSLPLIGGFFAPPSVPTTAAPKPEKRRRPAVPRPPAEDRSATAPPAPSLALRAPFPAREGARPDEMPQAPAPTLSVAKAQDPIVAESHSLASVIEPWHRTHNASAALALLDAHEQRYPDGRLHLETRMLRAEIYLSQGRETEALAVLDSLALSGIPRARELQTVRGELRIKAGRCPEGKRDLSDVLEKSVADSLAKRAAQALHHCP